MVQIAVKLSPTATVASIGCVWCSQKWGLPDLRHSYVSALMTLTGAATSLNHCMDMRPGEDGSCKEWAIVELQGDLETRHPVPLSGKFIGDLHFTDKDVPVLIIGHHILHGKVVTLEKPLAVIAKALNLPDSADNTHDSADNTHLEIDTADEGHSQTTASKKETCYHIQAIIRRKILFKTRPKPIIAHVPKKL